MDDAEKRRGRPALHRRFNEALAIQAALWLLGISRSLLTRAAAKAGSAPGAVDPVGAAARVSVLQQQTEDALHLGQFLDLVGSLGRAEVDPEEVARLKCGRLFALAAEVPAAGPALADAYYELVHERCAAAPVVRTTRPTAPHETLVAEHACNAGRMPSLSWPTWRPGAPRRTTLSRNTTLSAGALRLRRESSAPLLRSTAC